MKLEGVLWSFLYSIVFYDWNKRKIGFKPRITLNNPQEYHCLLLFDLLPSKLPQTKVSKIDVFFIKYLRSEKCNAIDSYKELNKRLKKKHNSWSVWVLVLPVFFFFLLTCKNTTVIRLAGPVCKKQRILNRVTSQTAVTIANIDIKIMSFFCLSFVSSCTNISPYNWFKVSHGYLLRPMQSKSNCMVKLLGEPFCKKKKNTFQKLSRSQVLLPVGIHEWGVISLFCRWQPFHLALYYFLCYLCTKPRQSNLWWQN